MLAPLFPEPQNKWLLVRQKDAEQGGFDYPFMMNDAPFMPAARPTLRSGQQVELSLVAYNLGVPEPEAAGSVYNSSGEVVGEVDIVLGQRSVGDEPDVDRYVATLAVPELEPGFYRLEVALRDGDTEMETVSSIPLRIDG